MRLNLAALLEDKFQFSLVRARIRFTGHCSTISGMTFWTLMIGLPTAKACENLRSARMISEELSAALFSRTERSFSFLMKGCVYACPRLFLQPYPMFHRGRAHCRPCSLI